MADWNDNNDNDGFIFGKHEGFSHDALVLLAYKKALECLAKEMREGFWMERVDKMGNQIYVYQPDTRKEAIEAIKTLKNILIHDVKVSDAIKKTDYGGKIKDLEKKSADTFKKALEMQRTNITKNLRTPEQRQAHYMNHGSLKEVALDDKSPYWHWYIEQKIDIYRELFEQLELSLAANGYMKGRDYTEGDED